MDHGFSIYNGWRGNSGVINKYDLFLIYSDKMIDLFKMKTMNVILMKVIQYNCDSIEHSTIQVERQDSEMTVC